MQDYKNITKLFEKAKKEKYKLENEEKLNEIMEGLDWILEITAEFQWLFSTTNTSKSKEDFIQSSIKKLTKSKSLDEIFS
jgi:hypothetical protein